MAATLVTSAGTTGTPPTSVVDPAYTALTLAAGSLLFLGTESTVSVSTLRLASRVGQGGEGAEGASTA